MARADCAISSRGLGPEDRRGAGLEERIAVADARKDSSSALDRIEAGCRAAGLDEPTALEVRLVAEEVLTNIAKYAFDPGATPVAEVVLSVTGAEAILEFRDAGRPFDPLAQPPPDLDVPLEERSIGGLGLPLVRALVDEARYVREGPTNVLRLVKRRPPR
jgi:anti-sigma regulatory factor (Ser/Thr protein kinase)